MLIIMYSIRYLLALSISSTHLADSSIVDTEYTESRANPRTELSTLRPLQATAIFGDEDGM